MAAVAIAVAVAAAAVAAAEVAAADKFQKAVQNYRRTHSNVSVFFYISIFSDSGIKLTVFYYLC